MPNNREVVTAMGAPAAVGPYSHAVKARGLLFCSGQIPLDPDSGELVAEDDPGAQATRCLENLSVVCAAAGTRLDEAVRVTIYTTRMSDFGAINDAYGEFFAGDPPARVAIGVAELPKGALVEIDAVVALTD
jgi:2-iminobutanoate/2-iminopropanoate deaminase